ncbi:MAG TPA: hypothetical protein VM536_07900 [Chloroflexia bacterium]|nr:hypothetical protein [Chloroflexia bacterium]
MKIELAHRRVLSRVAVAWASLNLAVCLAVAVDVFVRGQRPAVTLAALVAWPWGVLSLLAPIWLAVLANIAAHRTPSLVTTILPGVGLAVAAVWLWRLLAGVALPAELEAVSRNLATGVLQSTLALILALRPRVDKVHPADSTGVPGAQAHMIQEAATHNPPG